MERKIYLNRYRLCVDRVGIPVVIRRSADETTLKADDIESGAQVAVQVEPAASLGKADREQLAAEARAAQQINHVNIPVLRDFGFDGDQVVYVTEYLEGVTAEDWIKTRGPMPVRAVLRIASQVVSALVAGSLHGIIHYAINPANLMLVRGETADGEGPLVKVLNFLGVAPSLSPTSNHWSASFNPADFASPEQLQDGPINFRSAIYSLGCTLWFLLKGVPLSGGAAAVPEANGVPASVRQLLVAMLAANPANRPGDPLALHQQIQDCLAQTERRDPIATNGMIPTMPAPQRAKELTPVPRRHSGWNAFALAAMLFIIAALAAVIFAQRAHQAPEIAHKETPIRTAKPAAPAALPISNPSIEVTSPETASNQPNRYGMEVPAPTVASNSPSPEPAIALAEMRQEQLPIAPEPEALAPAEGPAESDAPFEEITLVQPTPPVEEEAARETAAVTSPESTPKKTPKSDRASATPAKKKVAAAASDAGRPSLRYLPSAHDHINTVGHIFFPYWPDAKTKKPAPSPSPHEEKRSSGHDKRAASEDE